MTDSGGEGQGNSEYSCTRVGTAGTMKRAAPSKEVHMMQWIGLELKAKSKWRPSLQGSWFDLMR